MDQAPTQISFNETWLMVSNGDVLIIYVFCRYQTFRPEKFEEFMKADSRGFGSSMKWGSFKQAVFEGWKTRHLMIGSMEMECLPNY